MSINFKAPENVILKPVITVVGVGGAGGNAVNNMIEENLQGANFLVANTDAQALSYSRCPNKLQLGAKKTMGLGAGASPEVGKAAAEESDDEIRNFLRGSHMVFITAGMGGGTGTGGAPVIARIAKEEGALTVGVVTKPFHFEGAYRMKSAEYGLEALKEEVDTLIIIPNQNLFCIANERTTFTEAFKLADEVLKSGVKGITDLMTMPGLINLDFADIKTVMSAMGKAMMGTGEASGEDRAIKAAEAAIRNPLLDIVSMRGAKGVLINITGGKDMTLFEVDSAANRIRQEVDDPEANLIFGSTLDIDLEGVIRVSVVATGIDAEQDASRAQEVRSQNLAKEQSSALNVVEQVAEPVALEEEVLVAEGIDEPVYNESPAQSYERADHFQSPNQIQSVTRQVVDKAPRQSLLSKMWSSLKSNDKDTSYPHSNNKHDTNANYNPNMNSNYDADVHEVPAFLRKNK